MRAVTISCDVCGRQHPVDRRPDTWWTLEQLAEVIVTCALDFCSLRCLALWVADPRVLAAYPKDFTAKEDTPRGV